MGGRYRRTVTSVSSTKMYGLAIDLEGKMHRSVNGVAMC